MKFEELSKKVIAQANIIESGPMFKVELADSIVEAYLNAFEDADERQHHNCNCCKSFLKQYGNIVGIKDGKIVTLWDFEIEGLFSNVPKVLGNLVRNAAISSAFVTKEKVLGTPISRTHNKETNEVIQWGHFYWPVAKSQLYTGSKTIESYVGDLNTNRAMLYRALSEISSDAIETVLSLIESNSLYRGQEYQKQVYGLAQLKMEFDGSNDKELFAWANLMSPASRIRNSSIGTLLVDLSEGRDLESAVGAFERMVAPSNYKRPTSLVTPKMIEQAKEKVAALGLTSALERRYATNLDISINNILYTNKNKPVVLDLFDDVAKDIPVAAKSVKVSKEMGIDEFITNVLPNSTNIEVLTEDRFKSNFMTLVAPVHEDAGSLFSWDNNFSWSYADGLADSLKERVKQAGGSVEGELRVSLEWFNYDDLDLHVIEPNDNRIYFSEKRSSYSGGFLDVDMNAGGGNSREAVENIIFKDKKRMLEGKYTVIVNNFAKRENIDMGFTIEVECNGEVTTFNQSVSPADSRNITVVVLEYSKEHGIKIIESLDKTSSTRSNLVYGVGTNKFNKVNTVMLSPNYWELPGKGNKHYFFILDNAVADNEPRGIFNEFLKPELNENRKVFELLGSKIKLVPSAEQLNGIGFSETMKNYAIFKVDGKVIKVLFGSI